MRYLGGKFKLAKHILPIILKNRKEGQFYVEPFLGGANTFYKVQNPKIGSDNNRYLMEMWAALQSGWIPPTEVSEEKYKHIKNNKEENPALTAFIGFGCSFGGKFFGGYARGELGRNYTEEGVKSLQKKILGMKDCLILHKSYDELDIPDNSIIYCDPPYQGTTSYSTGNFDHNKFWDKVREWSNQGHEVYVSEYNAPEDFECIFEHKQKCVLSNFKDNITKDRDKVERLFTIKG